MNLAQQEGRRSHCFKKLYSVKSVKTEELPLQSRRFQILNWSQMKDTKILDFVDRTN